MSTTSPPRPKLPYSCATLPSSTALTIFHCSFCSRLSHYPTYWNHDSITRCLHCPHTHNTTHHIHRVSPTTGKVLRHDCDRCRIYAYYALHQCWACGGLSDKLTIMEKEYLFSRATSNVEDGIKCSNWLSGRGSEEVQDEVRCGYILDSSCRMQWVGGVSRPKWRATRTRGMVAGWCNEFWLEDEVERRDMVWVDGPGGIIGESVKVMEGEERVWEEVDVHVIIDEK